MIWMILFYVYLFSFILSSLIMHKLLKNTDIEVIIEQTKPLLTKEQIDRLEKAGPLKVVRALITLPFIPIVNTLLIIKAVKGLF